MHKKTLTTLLATVGFVAFTYGQGSVNFATKNQGTSAKVRDVSGTNVAGANFFAQLYYTNGTGAASATLVKAGIPFNFRTGANAGWVQPEGYYGYDPETGDPIGPYTNSLGQVVEQAVIFTNVTPAGGWQQFNAGLVGQRHGNYQL